MGRSPGIRQESPVRRNKRDSPPAGNRTGDGEDKNEPEGALENEKEEV